MTQTPLLQCQTYTTLTESPKMVIPVCENSVSCHSFSARCSLHDAQLLLPYHGVVTSLEHRHTYMCNFFFIISYYVIADIGLRMKIGHLNQVQSHD